ncbi:16S rRNA (guanine(527)-N(7))-methyltransferase RsmG [Flavobacteriales bacterium]|nr:16S rRNA (guanine(527)-N(7))-methyltransferase RsmG [Flavobacteriales bacterium]
MESIVKYFPDLSEKQIKQFSELKGLYQHWNEQINVISRKDIDNFYERHVLHSLAIAKVISFEPETTLLDVGTGGGFPGIPLAILFPECKFHLVDSIGKKIKVVNEVSIALGLTNLSSEHQRAEEIKGSFDFVISRAVTRLNRFIPWVNTKFKSKNNNTIRNGILYLKGGDLHEELNEAKLKYKPTLYKIPDFFEGEFFETKQVVYVPIMGE